VTTFLGWEDSLSLRRPGISSSVKYMKSPNQEMTILSIRAFWYLVEAKKVPLVLCHVEAGKNLLIKIEHFFVLG
jgi:hypothetical protein